MYSHEVGSAVKITNELSVIRVAITYYLRLLYLFLLFIVYFITFSYLFYQIFFIFFSYFVINDIVQITMIVFNVPCITSGAQSAQMCCLFLKTRK